MHSTAAFQSSILLRSNPDHLSARRQNLIRIAGRYDKRKSCTGVYAQGISEQSSCSVVVSESRTQLQNQIVRRKGIIMKSVRPNRLFHMQVLSSVADLTNVGTFDKYLGVQGLILELVLVLALVCTDQRPFPAPRVC